MAALLVSDGLRGQAAVNRILATAKDGGPPGPDPEYGAGIVNAREAVSGLGGGAAAGGGGAGSGARVSVRRVVRIRAALRRGIRVRCRAAGTGRCRASATRRRKRLGFGSHRVAAGRTATIYVRPNRRGRRLLRRALRLHRTVRLRVRVTVPGGGTQVRRVTLKP